MNTARSAKLFFAFAIVAIIGLLWLAYFYFTLAPVTALVELPGTASSTTPMAHEPSLVVVEPGDGLDEIGSTLAGAGVIRSESAFKMYSILSGSAHQLKPGLYTVSPASSTTEIVRLLVAGPTKEITVVIPEGETLASIERTLVRYGVIRTGAFAKIKITDFYDQYPFLLGARTFEGFLFPDTYRFYFDSDPTVVIETMLNNFSARVDPLISDGATVDYASIPITRRGIYSIKDITTIASMIEKEVPDSAERKLVADIIYRRLRIDMPLQIDATTQYAATHGEHYDTYQYYGLPPGPIASPGLDAIDAALNPKSSSYLYYLSDPETKKTIFAKTFEEHKANKLKYL